MVGNHQGSEVSLKRLETREFNWGTVQTLLWLTHWFPQSNHTTIFSLTVFPGELQQMRLQLDAQIFLKNHSELIFLPCYVEMFSKMLQVKGEQAKGKGVLSSSWTQITTSQTRTSELKGKITAQDPHDQVLSITEFYSSPPQRDRGQGIRNKRQDQRQRMREKGKRVREKGRDI